MILTAFSQKDIPTNTSNKDTTVILPNKEVGKAVIKDIIKGDSAIAELEVVKDNLKISENNHIIKDSIINNNNRSIKLYQEKEIIFNKIIESKDQQLNIYQDLAKELNKKYKKEKRNRIFSQLLMTAAIGFSGYILLTK